MYTILTCAILLTAAVVVQGSYIFYPQANAWVQEHRVIATWDEAFRRCKSEGAVLMSPLNQDLLDVMRSHIRKPYEYFIGANARFHSGLFVSVEGVPLEDMPVLENLELLDRTRGQCLSINGRSMSIHIVSCLSRLPFMCYKEQNDALNITECGTIDKGYKMSNSTGSCYKFHATQTSWSDAYSTCILEGGYLAIINDNNEANEILNFMVNKLQGVHIGSKDWNGNGDWMSIFGDSIHDIYNVWDGNKQPKESCCQIALIDPVSGILKAYGNDFKSYFICEKNPNNIRFPYKVAKLIDYS